MELGSVAGVRDPEPVEESILLTRARTPQPVQQPLAAREPEQTGVDEAWFEQVSPGPALSEPVVALAPSEPGGPFPVAAALTAAPSRGPVPPEVVLAALAVFGLGATLLYPVLRYGSVLVPGLFQDEFSRALACLLLSVFVLLATYGVALCVVAVQLLRGSPVARGTACLFVGAVTIGAVVVGLPTTLGASGPSTLGFGVAAAGLAVLALLTLTPGARRFFSGRAHEPVSVLAAATVVVYIGVDLIAAGALLLPAVPLDGHFLLWGLLLMGGGAGLLWANRGLKDGSQAARVLVSLVFVAYAIICFVIEQGSVSIAAVIATTVAVGMGVALWVDPASVAHFSGRPVATDVPPHRLGVTAVVGSVLVGGVLLSVAHQQGGAAAQASTAMAAQNASILRTMTSTSLPSTYDQPTTYSAAPSTTPPSGRAISPSALGTVWGTTETAPGGYSIGLRLEAGVPVRYADGLNFGTLAAGSACSVDPARDALIPVRVTLTNTTPGFAVGASFNLGFGSDWSEPQAEIQYTDGPACKGSEGVGVSFTDPLAPSVTASSSMLIVLHGYYSPNFPKGDPQVLARATVYFEDSIHTADNGSASTTYTPGPVTGPGASAGSAMIPLSAAG
jgi:hypothetical protein